MLSSTNFPKLNLSNITLLCTIIAMFLFKYFSWTYDDLIYNILTGLFESMLIYHLYLLLKKATTTDRFLCIYLFLAFLFNLICDLNYFLITNIGNKSYVSNFWNSFYYIPHLISICFLAIFWFVYTNQRVQLRHKYWVLFSFLLLDLLFLTVFVYDSSWIIRITTYLGMFNVITGFIDIIIFNLIIVSLISSKNKHFELFSIGCLLFLTYNIWLKYLFLNKNINSFHFGISLEVISILIILKSIYSMSKNESFLKTPINHISGIKVQLTFFIYITLIFSFCILFFLAKNLTIINTGSLASLPVLIMVYSIIMVILAKTLGGKFERPFEQLEYYTEELIKSNDFNKPIDYDYGISELNNFQYFIIKQLKINKEHVNSQLELHKHVMNSIHNIRSPLGTISNLFDEVEQYLPKNKMLKFKQQIATINKTASKLLAVNSSITNKLASEEAYHVLTSTFKNIVENKLLEWEEDVIEVEFQNELIWIKYAVVEFQNIISNLLNNAFEATKNKSKKLIKIKLEILNNQIHIVINDNGCGIPSKELVNIQNGKSLKPTGNGIGVSSAKEYIESCNGLFSIDSIEFEGTNVYLTLPYNIPPKWYISEIKVSKYKMIVVDNDPEILSFWQRKLIPISEEIQYFCSNEMFLDWCSQKPNFDEYLVLMDFELDDKQIYGLDLLVNNHIPNAVLITDYAEHLWLQNQISKTDYYLLPKSALDLIRLT